MATNRIELKGYVHKIERITKTAKPLTSIRLGVSQYAGRNEDGTPRYHRDWFDVVGFDGMGDRLINAGIKEGDYIEVTGSMRSRRPKEDGPMYWSVVANDFDILRRADGEAVDGDKPDDQAKAAPESAAAPAADDSLDGLDL